MAKIRLNMTVVVTDFTSKWIIDNEPEAWDAGHKEVEIEVNEFKRLALMTNDKDELAELIMDWVREDELNRDYKLFVDDLLLKNRVE